MNIILINLLKSAERHAERCTYESSDLDDAQQCIFSCRHTFSPLPDDMLSAAPKIMLIVTMQARTASSILHKRRTKKNVILVRKGKCRGKEGWNPQGIVDAKKESNEISQDTWKEAINEKVKVSSKKTFGFWSKFQAQKSLALELYKRKRSMTKSKLQAKSTTCITKESRQAGRLASRRR